jgi:hypothetical protein
MPASTCGQPASQSVIQPACQPVIQPACQPVIQPACQPVSQPACQPVSQPACQPVIQSACQPACQSSSQPVSLPASQPGLSRAACRHYTMHVTQAHSRRRLNPLPRSDGTEGTKRASAKFGLVGGCVGRYLDTHTPGAGCIDMPSASQVGCAHAHTQNPHWKHCTCYRCTSEQQATSEAVARQTFCTDNSEHTIQCKPAPAAVC